MAIRRVDFRGRNLSKSGYRDELPRAALDIAQALKSIEPILNIVKSADEGDLLDLCDKFDGVRPEKVRVPKEVITSALKELDPKVRSALEEAISRVRKVHTDQIRQPLETQVVAGGKVSHRQIPVDRVGLYVPGGRAVYPSSVIMNVVPAQLAKVTSIAIASPPQIENGGYTNKTILATCALLGIDEVYAIGGAQAIAMFAYGVLDVCESVDVVTGPGNIYVAAAKRALSGLIGIDSEAGPTEVMVVADSSALASDVAADLISQAEHYVIAAALLVTDSVELADAVEIELSARVAKTKHADRISKALAGNQSAIVLVDSISQALDVANAYAAEHLEIQTADSRSDALAIRNAGAVFIGRFTPVSLGDYSAG